MNSNEILFVGIGQAGNNMTSEVVNQNKRINGMCINTSKEDIKSITNIKTNFIVPGAAGTGKDRQKAKMYVKDHIYGIIDKLNEFPQQKHIYFTFSMGGGTGSGIAPLLIAVLANLKPNLKVNIVPILPADNESKKAHSNTLECWNELMKLKNVNTIYLLDNNKKKTKQAINREFATLFNDFLNSTESHKDGIIDGQELTLIGTAQGLSAIYRLDNYVESPENLIAEELEKSIFVLGKTKCQYLGITIPDEKLVHPLLDIYTITHDYFIGYTSTNPLLMVGGAKADSKAVIHIKDILDERMKQIQREEETSAEEEVAVTVDFEPVNKKSPEEKKEEKSIDDLMESGDDFWNSVLNM